jgi:hypothetical protein
MSTVEQEDTNHTPIEIAGPDSGASVDKIRDILFGSQIKNYEARFARLEENLVRETVELKDTMRRWRGSSRARPRLLPRVLRPNAKSGPAPFTHSNKSSNRSMMRWAGRSTNSMLRPPNRTAVCGKSLCRSRGNCSRRLACGTTACVRCLTAGSGNCVIRRPTARCSRRCWRRSPSRLATMANLTNIPSQSKVMLLCPEDRWKNEQHTQTSRCRPGAERERQR